MGTRNSFSVCICGVKLVFSWSSLALADGAVLLSGLRAGRSGYWLDGRGQGTEETSDEGEAEASPGAEHGPTVAVANVVGQAVQVPRVTGKLKVDASDAGTERDDAKGSCKDRKMLRAGTEFAIFNIFTFTFDLSTVSTP